MVFDVNEFLAVLGSLVTALVALYKYLQTHEMLKAVEHEEAKVIEFYTDPVAAEKMPELLCKLPPRSYMMSDDVKKFLVYGEAPEDQRVILAQVAAAEAQGRVQYEIQYPHGYYKISYGQIEASGRGK